MKLVRMAGVIPMMAIFLSDRILLVVDEFTRVRAFQRAIPHGDLASVAALEVRAGPPDAFRRWLRALLDPRRVEAAPVPLTVEGISQAFSGLDVALAARENNDGIMIRRRSYNYTDGLDGTACV